MPNQQLNSPSAGFHDDALIRLSDVLKLIPVGKSTWWAGCKSGRFPAAVKLGPGVTAWRYADIRALATKGVA